MGQGACNVSPQRPLCHFRDTGACVYRNSVSDEGAHMGIFRLGKDHVSVWVRVDL